METSQIEEELSINTPKRPRDTDDISPESKQKSKEVKAMTSNEEIKQFMKAMNDNMSAMNAKLNAFDDIREDLSQIKKENADFKKSLREVNQRVQKVEEHIEMLNDNDEKLAGDLKREIQALKVQNNTLEQSHMNNAVIIRNLPKDMKDDQDIVTAVKNIFSALQIDVNEDEFEAYAYDAYNKKTANINVKFSSIKKKKYLVKRYRESKKTESEPLLLVNKIVGLPIDHELNGKSISISNQLTQYNTKLLQFAREYVPSHFAFAFDTIDGIIKVKVGDSFRKVSSIEEIEHLVSNNAGTSKLKASKRSQKSFSIPTSRVTRSNKEL